MRYTKRPVTIDAVQWREDNLDEVQRFIALPPELLVPYVVERRTVLDIQTLEGTIRATLGDWIIRGVKGEVYPCKPDIFEATYVAEEES